MNNRILYTPKEKKNYKKSRQHPYRLRLFFGLAAVAACALAATSIARMSTFQIQKITIRGLKSINENDVRREVERMLGGSYIRGLIPYRFLLAAPAQIIATDIKEQFPLIVDASITKEFPNQLTLALGEREFFAILCNDRKINNEIKQQEKTVECAYVDTNGIAYQRSPESAGFLITKISTDAASIPVPSQAIERATVDRIIFLQRSLPPLVGSPVIDFELFWAIPHEIRAVSNEGVMFIFKRDDDFGNVFRVLKKVWEHEIGNVPKRIDYIDLRFGNKVFYKMR